MGDIPSSSGDFVGCICWSARHTSSALKLPSSTLFILGVTLLLTASKLAPKIEGWSELNIDEKYSRMIFFVASCSSCHIPPSSIRPPILFFRCLWLVEAWKNFVFLSPFCNQSTRDRWFHIISSLMWSSFIFLQTALISFAISWSMLRDSSC